MARISKPNRICFILSTVALLFLSLVCVIGIFTFNYLFSNLISKKLAILPGSEVYNNWISPSVPVYFSIYLYNLTNPHEVLRGGRPRFAEVGPYVYREDRQRINVQFSSESPPKTVQFQHRIFYHFQPDLSVGPDDQGIVTSLDLVTVGVDALPDLYSLVSLLYTFTPFVSLTPREIIWGYQDSFLAGCMSLKTCDTDRAGLMAQNNGTKVSNFVIDTGAYNISNVGKVLKYNGATSLNYWRTDYANMINGTDGSVIRPGLQISSRIFFFVPDFCRSFHSDAVGWTTATHDSSVHLLKFASHPEQSQNATVNPLNAAFCPKQKAGPDCPPTGMIPLSPCSNPKIPVPIFACQPHFLGADPSIRAAMDGIREPNEKLDSTVLHIEPNTGFVLEAFKKVQINAYVENSGQLSEVYQDMAGPYFFPIAWFTEFAVADKKALSKISNYILKPKKVIPIILSTVGSLALISAVILIAVLLTRYKLSKTDSTSIQAQAESTFIPTEPGFHSKSDESPFVHWSVKPSPEHDSLQVMESKPLLKPSDTAGRPVA
ncbi:Lysosome membrane protein isoform 1 [Schistosoma japonicum]|uniref:Lysosome membrane protein isoform 1 n=1 Tax=Schistosoma japonicum TaxID=6182 RepID=Q5DCK2_SCHJA|nr:SJCHGC06304 protein [Schistosoma japonicum]KAH8864874.1 Lysosome membrane protein 2 [Schistosoma japonicum]KAH8864875.1 Lysosome membrane protein 2 [Schistosoma japonicum]KAH8864877.1 Lysosome membrane protein 2 [Schistosoma japonicum]TNN13252.1 Lysosome membrane protein isoform 1 [Schistosoma japonicum]